MTTPQIPPLAPRAALRWNVVRRVVSDLNPTTILELGCGQGAMGSRLAGMATYLAAEPDDSSFETAHARITPLGGTVIHGDHNKVPSGTTYDVVCAFEVLEHIADDAGALAGWMPLVKPGGHLVLSVPSEPDRFGPWDELVGHYRRYDAASLTARLTEAGGVDVEMIHYGWPLGYLLDSVRDRLAGGKTAEGDTAEERTSGSGRILQPSGAAAGTLIKAAVAPWIGLQRLRPGKGPGLVAVAKRPAA
ncbi:class I SAM-dependent methyltransferase [Asanoa sp. NPDC049518]|uniref:class I SAM-dependent methyltransferase n=1 Tax=unclassified Asanoa TaxID=2685164 RepID=UPI003430718D